MVGSQTDQPQTVRKSLQESSLTPCFDDLVQSLKRMRYALGETYQMCLIGSGVCRIATRDPP